MKKIVAVLAFCFFACYGYGQDCPEYRNLIKEGDRHLAKERYSQALSSYLNALRHCDAKMDSVMLKLKRLFNKINTLKEQALRDRDSAEVAKNLVIEAKDRLSHTVDQLNESKIVLQRLSDLIAQYADSLQDLRNRIVYERDSLQKTRVRELQEYAKLVKSVIGSRKKLDPITTNLQQIIAKENQTAIIQDKQRIGEPELDTFYAGITIPEVSMAPLAIQKDFLVGEGTTYALTLNAGRRKDISEIKAIVIHVTEASRRATVNWFINRKAKVSTHIVIDTDGAVVQLVPFSYSAWHAGVMVVADTTILKIFSSKMPNPMTIGIDLVGSAGKPFTERQLQVCKTICTLLKRQYNIEYILGHSQINNSKNCPGSTFPLDQFRSDIFLSNDQN